MTIIFDLDYTLLDTARFKKDIASVLEQCGITEERFLEAYAENVEKGELIRDFDALRYVTALRGDLTCTEAEAAAKIGDLSENMNEYFFPNAEWLLEKLKAEGHSLKLLTHGNIEWQKKKIANTGIKDVFDEIIYAPENKDDMKDALEVAEAPVVMVNDHGREIDALGMIFPAFHMIAVKGPKPPPSDQTIPVCADLINVYQEIKKLV